MALDDCRKRRRTVSGPFACVLTSVFAGLLAATAAHGQPYTLALRVSSRGSM
jgi:hypothetical protein